MLTNLSIYYGMGVKVIDDFGAKFIGHSGDFYGYHSCIYGYLDDGKGVVILTNGDGGVTLYNEIIRSVAKNYKWPGTQHQVVQKIQSRLNFDQIAGCYFIPGILDILNVINENGKLYCNIFGLQKSELEMISPTVFYNNRLDGFFTFKNDSNNTINEVKFKRIGVKLPGYRMKNGFDLLFGENYKEGTQVILKNKDYYAKLSYFENVFNSIGYSLLFEKKHQNAINVFALGTTLFPEAVNLMDSLGEAYLEYGDTTNAIKYYDQALKINPNYSNAKHMLNLLMNREVKDDVFQEWTK